MLCIVSVVCWSFLFDGNVLFYARWEEERYTDGVKWKFLEHKGPVFAPPYEPLSSNVKFYYDGELVFPKATWILGS